MSQSTPCLTYLPQLRHEFSLNMVGWGGGCCKWILSLRSGPSIKSVCGVRTGSPPTCLVQHVLRSVAGLLSNRRKYFVPLAVVPCDSMSWQSARQRFLSSHTNFGLGMCYDSNLRRSAATCNSKAKLSNQQTLIQTVCTASAVGCQSCLD